MFASAEACVSTAAAMLDQIWPDWFKRIDVDTIGQEYHGTCVLGQMFDGDYHFGLKKIAEFMNLPEGECSRDDDAQQHFTYDQPHETGYAFASPDTNDLWRAEVNDRLGILV